jgi:hypothetical protein
MRIRAGFASGRRAGSAALACNVSMSELKMAAGMPIPISPPLFPLSSPPCMLAYSVAC